MRTWRVAYLSVIVVGLLDPVHHAGAQSTITVGPNVQVSKVNAEFEHEEVLACADPRHPDRLIVVSIVNYTDRFRPWTTAYASFDGGKTWAIGVQNRPPADSEISEDPACAYGPDGTAYFVAVDGSLSTDRSAVSFLYRSPDGGKKWLSHSTIIGAFDRPYVSVDGTGGKYNGRIYVSHNGAGGLALQRSLDGGQTWLGPALRPILDGQQNVPAIASTPNPANTVVLSNGSVVSLIRDDVLRLARSSNGGEHYTDEAKVADYAVSHNPALPATIPNIAVDPGSPSFRDRLYAVWQTVVADHQTERAREESVISYSADEGKTWSTPRRIDDGPTAINTRAVRQYQTTVAVNKEGVVGAMWYEGFETDTTQGYWVRFAASLDGGETWTPSARVSDAPCTFGVDERPQMNGKVDQGPSAPLNLKVWTPVRLNSGDTAGLVADALGVFHAVWIGSCDGVRQVWTAPVVVSGPVQRNGARELADLEELSGKVKLTLTHTAFEPRSGELATTLTLQNVSERTIRGPLKLRILTLRSDVGTPEVLHSANGVLRDGAIVDLSAMLRGGELKPGGVPVATVLEFMIADAKLRSEGQWHIYGGGWGILTLQGRLFGNAQPLKE